MDEDVEDLRLGVKSRFVEAVCHYIEDVSAYTHVILTVEDVRYACILIDVRQNFLE